MNETFEMQNEEPTYTELVGAEGGIQYGEKHDINVVNELTERVRAGEFHVPTTGRVPCKCIDGRICEYATEGPNAAGGTETIFVADDLTTRRFAGADGSVADGMRNAIALLQVKNYPVGGHSDDHHTDPEDSGCGANDRLEKIYNIIAREPNLVKQYVEAILSTTVDDETHALIVGNAGGRVSFSRGNEVLEVFKQTQDAKLEELEGHHNEVVAVINKKPGTTLDRKMLAEVYGANYQAFNVDAWSFQEAAAAIAEPGNDKEILQKIIAMVYYNVATALVLCGPKMRVVIREDDGMPVAA